MPVNVEVAVELFKIDPPEMLKPFEDESPAVDIPPAKVDVAVEEELILSRNITKPLKVEDAFEIKPLLK